MTIRTIRGGLEYALSSFISVSLMPASFSEYTMNAWGGAGFDRL